MITVIYHHGHAATSSTSMRLRGPEKVDSKAALPNMRQRERNIVEEDHNLKTSSSWNESGANLKIAELVARKRMRSAQTSSMRKEKTSGSDLRIQQNNDNVSNQKKEEVESTTKQLASAKHQEKHTGNATKDLFVEQTPTLKEIQKVDKQNLSIAKDVKSETVAEIQTLGQLSKPQKQEHPQQQRHEQSRSREENNTSVPQVQSIQDDPLMLWLRGDSGVVLSNNYVSVWNDKRSSTSLSPHSFVSLPDDVTNIAYGKLLKEHRMSSIHHGPDPPNLPPNQFHAVLRIGESKKSKDFGVPFVSFPCALKASSDSSSLKLHDQGLTLIFVIRPLYPGVDDSSLGQSFFGHYPSGQFRLLQHQAIFHMQGVDFSLPEGAGKVLFNDLNIIAYRIAGSGSVEISVNGAPFHVALPNKEMKSEDKLNMFSDSALHVGGVTSQCGFVGDVFEILVYGTALPNSNTSTLLQGLVKKYRASMTPAALEKVSTNSIIPPTSSNAKSAAISATTTRTSEPPANDSNPASHKPYPTAAKATSGVPGDACKTQEDPFKDPIEVFVPPRKADLKDKMAWDEALLDLKRKTTSSKLGGQPLRDKLRKQVMELRLLRFQLFCKYV